MKKDDDGKSTSSQKNRMAKNEFHVKWSREREKAREKEAQGKGRK